MKKKLITTLIKIVVSGLFLFFIFKKVDFSLLFEIFKNSNILLLTAGLIIFVGISFFLAFRWYIIVKIYLKEKKSLFFIWKLTMIGLFFNIFLPTSAGGDAVKIFYLVKDDSKKVLPATSVVIDRFIGSLTVLTMGFIALFFSNVDDNKIRIFIPSLVFILLFFYFFLSYDSFAKKVYSLFKKIIPDFLDEKLKVIYRSFNFYFREKKVIFLSILLSFFLQSLSIFGNFLVACGLIKSFSLPVSIFFVYIPLIWVATVIPSIGGLGIREFSYIFFFKKYLNNEKAFALSLIFLLSIIIQAVIGSIIFLTMKTAPDEKKATSG